MISVKNNLGGGIGKIPTGIYVATPPTKTSYKAGEAINLSGMTVKVKYSDDTEQDITSECTFSPAAGTTVYESTSKITVTWIWTKASITYTASQPITVQRVLSSIAIATQPTKKTYEQGDTLNLSGMVVKATYNSGATANVTGWTSSPANGATLPTLGSQTVTVSYTENGVTKTATLTVTVNVKVVTIANGTWAEISNMVQGALNNLITLSDYWSVGDTKSVTLTTGEVIELQIADFNHDTYSDGVTAPVTFIMKNCLNATSVMNSSGSNSGGYPASEMKTYVETNIYNKLPADLKAIVAPVKKKCYTTYNSASSLSEANYNVWLLSEMEAFGTNTYTIGNGEGTKYPIFTDNNSRIKKVNGSAYYWWLRSCISSGSTRFVRVASDGSASVSSAYNSNGVVVGLCIR